MNLLATCYMPPAIYMAKVFSGKTGLWTHERFVKQNIRTRTHILSPNGVQSLIIPVRHEQLNLSNTSEVRISYQSQWRRQHFRSLKAAYGRSAFFEYYEVDLQKLYQLECDKLWEFNLETVNFISRCIDKEVVFPLIDADPAISNMDIGFTSNTSTPIQIPVQPEYMQVFRDRFPFVSGLSAIDLLMNLGPRSRNYLDQFPGV